MLIHLGWLTASCSHSHDVGVHVVEITPPAQTKTDSERTVEVKSWAIPVQAEKREWCLLVHAEALPDLSRLASPRSKVVLLVTGDAVLPVDQEAVSGSVLYRQGGTTREVRAELLREALSRFSNPLVQFRWFVWCSGESVRDGRCMLQAEVLASFKEGQTDLQQAMPTEAVGYVWWAHAGQLVRDDERLAIHH